MRIPADWELHQRSWIGLPANPELWQKRYYAARQSAIDLANKAIDFEPVNLVCPRGYGSFLTSYTDKRIEIVEADTGESWLRDISPIYVETDQGRVRAVFNRASRNLPCYPITRSLFSSKVKIGNTTLPLALENEAITTDGQGTGICTTRGVFAHRRNSDDHVEKAENLLRRFFGLEKILWVTSNLATDQVDGHITNLVRFISPGIVLIANHGNARDPNKRISIDCYDQLSEQYDNRGKKLAIYQVRNPPPITYKGIKLSASYTNFYIANSAVFIPSFYAPRFDKRAYKLFQELFPKHDIIQQPVLPLLTGGGGLNSLVCPQIAGSIVTSQLIRQWAGE